MKKQKREIKGNNFLLIGVILLVILVTGIIVSALTEDDKASLEAELNNLTQEISNLGYDWLIDYSGNDLNQSALIEVYAKYSDRLITIFEGVGVEGWYKIYLTSLGENESYDIFDLKVKGAGASVEDKIKIPWNVYEKKKRVDEIRGKLNYSRGNV